MNLEDLGLPLGQVVAQPDEFSPDHLAPVPRQWAREREQIDATRFSGVDEWNLWELSWLDGHGKPVQATGRFTVPHSSPNLIESKSIKLYFNSMNNQRFNSWDQVRERVAHDLSAKAGAPVSVELFAVDAGVLANVTTVVGESIDDVEWLADYQLDRTVAAGKTESAVLYSHAFRSLCQ